MSAAHTPGPWKVHPYIAKTTYNAGRDIGPHQLAVARAIGEFETDVPTDETDANARLIAAAPDLLAALIASHRHPERQHEAGEMPGECSACAAIFKAVPPEPTMRDKLEDQIANGQDV